MHSIEGPIDIPASKSYSQRALIASWLANGLSTIQNIGHSNDEQNVLQIVSKYTNVSIHETSIQVLSKGFDSSITYNLNIGESGLAARLIAPILAMSKGVHNLSGSGTILNRSMESLTSSFSKNNGLIQCDQNRLPLKIHGPLVIPSRIDLDDMDSSQIISGWIFALSAISPSEDIAISFRHAKSTPYIEMTVELLRHFGALILVKDQEVIIQKNSTLKGSNYEVEGDWSSASIFIVAAILNGNIKINGLNTNSLQADRSIRSVLNPLTTHFEINSNSIYISKKENPTAFDFDATNCPDLFPALSVLAAFSDGRSSITGLHRLKNKESNRSYAIKHNLELAGIKIMEHEDSFIIDGSSRNINKELRMPSFGDHRIAMMNRIVAMKNRQKTYIEDPVVVNKSFPNFFELFQQISK
jgi:3-phosphoshikimate 1-carboxyvinyltransferase